MKCADEGILQSYLDNELTASEKEKIEEHFRQCEECKSLFKELSENQKFAMEKIEPYESFSRKYAEADFKPFVLSHSKFRKGVEFYMYKYKKGIAVACAAAVVAVVITVQPVKTTFASALSIFRMQKLNGVTISMDDIKEIQSQIEQHKGEININKFGKINMKGGEEKWLSVDEAKKLQDLTVAFPSSEYGSNFALSTVEPQSMEFTLNVDNVNQILSSFGSNDKLPESLSGKTFMVNIPRVVKLQYSVNGKKYNVIETKTPEIIAPQDVNVDEIYNCLVDLPVIPKDIQAQLKSIKDWKTTAYIPVVKEKMQEVEVNGTKGYTINNGGESGVIWYKDGVFYEVNGNCTKDDMIKFAESMR